MRGSTAISECLIDGGGKFGLVASDWGEWNLHIVIHSTGESSFALRKKCHI